MRFIKSIENDEIVYDDWEDLDISESIATEAINYAFKKEYLLKDAFFKNIESLMPRVERIIFRHISGYEDRFHDILDTPYVKKCLPFGKNGEGEDADIIFRSLALDQDNIMEVIRKVPLPDMKNATEKAAFLPLQVVLLLIIRYYLVTKQLSKIDPICRYYGYSIYWKRFNKSFPGGVYDENIMEYTINNMTYRNLIKRLGSLKKLLHHIVRSKIDYYREDIVDASDEAIRYVLDQVQSDIGSKVNNLASEYNKNFKDHRSLLTSTMKHEDDNFRIDESNTAIVYSKAESSARRFFSDPIDINFINMAVSMSKDVSSNQIYNTVNFVRDTADIDELNDFYSSLFQLYFELDSPKATPSNLHSLLFVSLMRDVIIKGNSLNPNNIKIRNYIDKWLAGSNKTFRATNREQTKIGYRKAVYFYFLILVANTK